MVLVILFTSTSRLSYPHISASTLLTFHSHHKFIIIVLILTCIYSLYHVRIVAIITTRLLMHFAIIPVSLAFTISTIT